MRALEGRLRKLEQQMGTNHPKALIRVWYEGEPEPPAAPEGYDIVYNLNFGGKSPVHGKPRGSEQ